MSSALFTASDLAGAARGDDAAFSRVFLSLQPLLLRYLGTLAGDAAEDLAADTWVQVVRGLPRFRGNEDGFRGWVFTIARGRWVDHVRRAVRAPPIHDESFALDLPALRQVEDQVVEMFSTEQALALIRRLPPDQAEVLVLRVVADLDVRTTASVIGKRPGAVRVLSHRGLRRLEEMLGQVPDPSGTGAGVTRRRMRSVTRES